MSGDVKDRNKVEEEIKKISSELNKQRSVASQWAAANTVQESEAISWYDADSTDIFKTNFAA